jgi:hypothetical protein
MKNTMRVRPVFVESKEPTNIIGWKGKLEYADDTASQLMDRYYKLILISTDSNYTIERLIDAVNNDKNCFGIVATQDQIRTDLIKILIDRYNGAGIHDFDIVAEEYDHDEEWSDISGAYETFKLRAKLTNGYVTTAESDVFISGLGVASGDDKSAIW